MHLSALVEACGTQLPVASFHSDQSFLCHAVVDVVGLPVPSPVAEFRIDKSAARVKMKAWDMCLNCSEAFDSGIKT